MPLAAISWTTAVLASSSWPNTVYDGGSCVSSYTMKNWDPLVFGPALAIAKVPAG